jgi:hypothetical protein
MVSLAKTNPERWLQKTGLEVPDFLTETEARKCKRKLTQAECEGLVALGLVKDLAILGQSATVAHCHLLTQLGHLRKCIPPRSPKCPTGNKADMQIG